ncbi:amino acid adenylation domain-containing protein [Streptomyces kasugaensis]|uniref:Amino acid adenylation domain-containing protein n=1 Tax=Streptomyces kasugaensis TaxID=1946 RepID=A0A4Q9I090_STRKA|nr:non-ribosomal peptide synthetase [Streptomyces kasugaensis]TBO60309.1 amino acid adenylation domain-containing protein [Streptomyces kasugaensis]
MNAYALLDLFNRHAITLVVDGDTLRCKAPRGFLTPELLAALKRHKRQLIAILTGQDGDADGTLVRRPDPAAALPLSFAQRQLWVLDQLAPGNPFYNNPAAIDIKGALDVAALTRGLTELTRRHEALRTVFGSIDGEPWQRVRPAGPVALPVTDLGALPAAERPARARRETEADARVPFDLSAGPLFRGRLLRLAADEHRLLLNVHHIVADGWSIGILVREIGALYGAYARELPSPLAEPSVQYPDYALWQRRQLDEEALARQLDHWTGRLAGAPTLLALPTDRPRPAVQRYQGQRHAVTVGAEVTRGLHTAGQAGRATLFMTLMATLSVLLWRYSGQDDICVGTPFANRGHREAEDLIGHFVNTLVIRQHLDPEQSFEALLAQVRDHVLDAYAHPDLPFDQLVEALRPERHTSHSPLFQVMLVLQNMPRGRLELPGLTMQPLPTHAGAAKFDLAVEVSEDADGLELSFEYNTDLFDAATVARMAGHYVRLLEQVAAGPARPVGALRLLGPAERQRQLHDWNATGRDGTAPAGLAERFAAQVRARPDQLAVVCGDDRLDYATLDRRANRLAQALVARGVRRDQVVGLHAGRSAELVVGILGILKAGAAYLPLDPALPAERLAGMVTDAGPALVLSEAAAPPPGRHSLVAVEAEGRCDDAPAIACHPAGLAYVIYTSGSTGRPKGVAVTHGSVANLFDHWLTEFGAVPGEAAALWSSIGFDVSVQEILLPLTSGGVLHLVPEELRADPEALMDWLRTHRIAQAYLPPAFVKWIDEAPAARLAGLALRQLLVGVEPLPEEGLHRIRQLLPGLRVLNGYGPTETTVYSTGYPDPRPLARQCPIGRPLANTRLYLLDERLEPVPVGVAGEIYLGGAGLARGYLGRPGPTAERFLPDPFVDGARMYRTGDLARWLPDGDAEYLGRRDDQVKLRGFRIELGEIEAALLDEPGVREAAVLVDQDAAGEPRLVAGVGRGAAPPLPPGAWRTALSRRLPGYMIPALFVELPHLPRTANGKLDRAALLLRAREGGSVQVNLASPRDHIELTLYQIWQRLLLQPDIGILDSFFDIGGSSISAIKMSHAIREAFGETLPIRDILLHPTIEELGGLLRQGASGRPPGNLIEFRAGEGRRRVVCVHPAGGTAFCYLSLAKALPEEYGVYGIQSPGVNPGETSLPTVEAMAEAYLRLIEPLLDGPLVLTGLSYGGLIAHEMGRRLASAGHTELSVVLLDTQGTDDPAQRALIEPVEMAEFREKLVKFNGMYPGIDDQQIDQYFHIYNHNRLTMRDYPAPSSSARLVLLQAVGDGPDTDHLRAVRAFWHRRADAELLVEQVPCDHWEMLETAEVRRVAALISSELARFPVSRPLPSAVRRTGAALAQES